MNTNNLIQQKIYIFIIFLLFINFSVIDSCGNDGIISNSLQHFSSFGDHSDNEILDCFWQISTNHNPYQTNPINYYSTLAEFTLENLMIPENGYLEVNAREISTPFSSIKLLKCQTLLKAKPQSNMFIQIITDNFFERN